MMYHYSSGLQYYQHLPEVLVYAETKIDTPIQESTMGLCCWTSKGPIKPYNVFFDNDEKIKRAKVLLKCDDKIIIKFYELFCKIDKSNSGEIPLDFLFAHFFYRNRSLVGDTIFEIADCSTNPDRVDFGSFCLGISTFCMCNQVSDIVQIIFYIYDKEKYGYLMRQDFIRFLKLTHNGKIGEKLSCFLELFPSDKIDYDELCQVSKMHSIVFLPIVDLQNAFKIACFGISWWIKRFHSKQKRTP